jgi:hypothetical protein
MMDPVSPTDAHLEDGELLRLVSAEADAPARAEAAAHLEACGACRERLEHCRTRRERFASLRASADFSPPVPLAPPSGALLRPSDDTAPEAVEETGAPASLEPHAVDTRAGPAKGDGDRAAGGRRGGAGAG